MCGQIQGEKSQLIFVDERSQSERSARGDQSVSLSQSFLSSEFCLQNFVFIA